MWYCLETLISKPVSVFPGMWASECPSAPWTAWSCPTADKIVFTCLIFIICRRIRQLLVPPWWHCASWLVYFTFRCRNSPCPKVSLCHDHQLFTFWRISMSRVHFNSSKMPSSVSSLTFMATSSGKGQRFALIGIPRRGQTYGSNNHIFWRSMSQVCGLDI